MAKDMEGYMAKVIANMEQKTGKKMQEYVDLLRATGLTKHLEQVKWLKEHHGLGHTQAQIIAWEVSKPEDYVAPASEELLAAQYKGKEHLKPIYDKAVALLDALGEGWELDYCKGYVNALRGRQFFVIQPSTKTRVDLGFRLPGMETGGRLLPAKNVGGGSITHMVSITNPDHVDEQVADWIRMAFVAAAK
jgi:hypothetical protein